jgi:hypothetical protein
MKNFKYFALIIISILFVSNISYSQVRYVVLPFSNSEGNMDLNIWCYKLQDSLQKAVIALDVAQKYIQMVPADSVEDLLAQLNLDPTNPQYQSDMWKAVKMLNVEKVLSGNFYYRGGKLIINAYVFDVRTKLADPTHQAKNIFKNPEEALTAINIIVQKLKPLLIREEK